MKKRLVLFACLTIPFLADSQLGSSTKSFVAKDRVDWEDGTTSKEDFFSLQIPSYFDYDTIFNFASGYIEKTFLQVDVHVQYDTDEFLKKVQVGNIYNLDKYAYEMTSELFLLADSSSVSNINKHPIQVINGISVLKIEYDLVEVFGGKDLEKKCILYLIPMFPKKQESSENDFQKMIFLTFRTFLDTEKQLFSKLAEQILETIKQIN